jgi:hypothetical protein
MASPAAAATQTKQMNDFTQITQNESFKDQTLDLIGNKTRLFSKWGVALLSAGQLSKVLPEQSLAIGVAKDFFNAANWGLAPKELVFSVDQLAKDAKAGKGVSTLTKGALKIAKVVKDLFKAMAAFGAPVIKAITFPLEGLCALGSAFFASKDLVESKEKKDQQKGSTKALNIISNSIEVIGAGLFLRTLFTGRTISPIISSVMGLVALTSAVAQHYIGTK